MTFIITAPYRIPRVLSLVKPGNDPLGADYQFLMIRRLVRSSQLFGEAVLDGNMAGMSLDRVLPGWATDLSLTYVIARFGYAAGVVIVGMLLVLLWRLFSVSASQKGTYGSFLSLAGSLSIAGQAVFYVLANLGLMAPFAWSLPFVSFGGTVYIVNMALLGLILSIHRRTNLVRDRFTGSGSAKPVFTLEEGKLVIDLGIGRPNRNSGRK